MGDAGFQPRFFRAVQRIQRHRLVVRVQNFDIRMLPHDGFHKPHILRVVDGVQPGAQINIPAQRANIVVIIARLGFVDQKVELHHITVDMAVIVHQHGFDACAVHVADRMQNPYHPITHFLYPYRISWNSRPNRSQRPNRRERSAFASCFITNGSPRGISSPACCAYSTQQRRNTCRRCSYGSPATLA